VPEQAQSRHILGRPMDRSGSGRMEITRSDSWRSATGTKAYIMLLGSRMGCTSHPKEFVLRWRSLRDILLGKFLHGFLASMGYLPKMLMVVCGRISFRPCVQRLVDRVA
jgi:hypothetical protein